jgi:N-acetylglutamate synthase-like GNAT family acetyltransferase
MTARSIEIITGDSQQIEAFLAQRIYEYNSRATGYFDAQGFFAIDRDASGEIQGGVSGYTWGGCCHVVNLWVTEAQRGCGLGTALLAAAERHAKQQNCRVVFLSSHSFQAPDFYERQGYQRLATVQGDPPHHSNVFLAKQLDPTGS